MTDLHTHAEEIREQFDGHLPLTVDEVLNKLETYVDEYGVPTDEARRSVRDEYLRQTDLTREDLTGGGSERVDIGSIDTPEQWVTVEATVVELWEPQSDAVAQVGLLGDPTGTIKFTKWSKSDLPALEEGSSYQLSNVVTDEYEGRFSVKLNRTTSITRLEDTIEVGDDNQTTEGALIDIQSGSGLIKRCPHEDCTRVLQNGRCSEHGDVDGEFDLRIKGVIDDGTASHEVIFNREITEESTGISLETAKDMAMDALDTTVVIEEMSSKILGRYYRVEGPIVGRYLLADQVTELDRPDTDTIEQTLIRARSI